MAVGSRIAAGERIYAIGDIHGRADLFAELISLIRIDTMSRPALRTRIIVLGDFIDRGPASAELTERLMRYSRNSRHFTVLMGNHEQIMLSAFAGNLEAASLWMQFGGDAALISWGVPEDLVVKGSLAEVMLHARRAVPGYVLRWLRRLKPSYMSGGVFFVHAGIKPGIAIAKQDPLDLMWIREEFTSSNDQHPLLIVHGHTITEDGPDVRENRVGIDTGAYRTHRLTALGLEGDAMWSISTTPDKAAQIEGRP